MSRFRYSGLAVLCAALQVFSAEPAFEVVNPGSAAVVSQAVTFGMVFAPGEIPAGKVPAAKVSGGGIHAIQVDVKATHADGSLRHAVLTVTLNLGAGRSERILLSPAAPGMPDKAINLADLLTTAYDAKVKIALGGKAYSASAREALLAAQAAGGTKPWLAGQQVTEWLVDAPLSAGPGDIHPHLHVRFVIRAYAGMTRVRTDVTVENGWAFEPNPSGFTYDVVLENGAVEAYRKAALAHTHHSRWRKVFWWGEHPLLEARPDADHLFSTGAVPRYDRTLRPPESVLARLVDNFEPMSEGDLTSHMPATGAHPDIGPLPRSAALYLLSLDPRARANVVANGEAGGAFQIHYRDKAKGRPVTIDEFPYMTILGNPGDTRNPATGKYESFPAVTNGLEKHVPDDAHQPSIAYLPYLLTGDFFFLEELQFWAQWNMILANPAYREASKGLLKWSQVRGQAWSMRTLGHAAYITPDADPLKAGFQDKLKNNLAWYAAATVANPFANKLGWLDSGYARAYAPNGIAPWQDDFFTWSIGHLADLGFAGALELARWKGRFVVGRMTDPGYCWLKAAAYSLQIGSADKTTLHETFASLYKANFPAATGCTGVAMDGYPEIGTGYPANMQPALAAAVDAGVPGAAEAWARYETRKPRQEYTTSPQFAVVPKQIPGAGIRRGIAGSASARGPRLAMDTNAGGLVIEWGGGPLPSRFDLKGKRLPPRLPEARP